MANVNAPRGLRPYQLAGEPETNEYTIASGYPTSLYQGDPIKVTGVGRNIELAPANELANRGVFWGARWVDQQGNQRFSSLWPANTVGTEIKALVIDDPDMIFEIQADTIAEANVGALIDWAAGTPNVQAGVSGAYAAIASVGTIGKSLRILGLVDRVDNDYGAFAKLRVKYAAHDYQSTPNGV